MPADHILTDAASVATAVGVLAVGAQTFSIRGQGRTNFEGQFVDRYRKIADDLPMAALLGSKHEPAQMELRAFYDYFELCEDELFYRSTGRISRRTWEEWRDGISIFLSKPAFLAAWEALMDQNLTEGSEGPPPFDYLHQAYKHLLSNEKYDPRPSVNERWSRRRHRIARRGSRRRPSAAVSDI